MKRTILILAVALAASAAGCGRDCDFATLQVSWVFSDPNGTALTCDQSGAAALELLVDGVPVPDEAGNTTFTCADVPSDSTPVFDITIGTHTVEIDALDSAGQVVAADQRSVRVDRCGTTDVPLAPITRDLNVTYSISDGSGNEVPCAQPGTGFSSTFIWFRMRDSSGNIASVADSANNPTAVPCSDTTRVFVVPSLPFGTYTIDGIEEVQLDNQGNAAVVSENCVPSAPFTHSTPGDTVDAPGMISSSTPLTSCF